MSETNTDESVPSVRGRLLFGAGLAVLALRNLLDLDGRVAYAEYKGVPAADKIVPVSSGLLLAGGLGVSLWKLPKIAAGSIVAFLVGVTPIMHNFWAVDEESRDEELTSFLQNVALLGAAIAFLKQAIKN